ncbi:MAG: hypothetical protein Fur0016_08720 [Anaerolineales bacterium]
MKNARLVILLLLVLSLFGQGFTPPPAPSPVEQKEANKPRARLVELTVSNNTGKYVSIVLDGTTQQGLSKVYTFSAYTGKSVFRVEAGVYLATFYGCGREASKKLQMKSSRRVILTCGNKENDPEDKITIK